MNKILFVIGLAKNGGAEKRARHIASLLKNKYDTKVLSFVSENPSDIDFSFKPSYLEYKKTSFKERISFLRKIIDEQQPDVVISFLPHINFFTTLALKKKRFNNIKHVIGITFPFYNLKETFFLKYSIKKAAAVYYQCNDQKQFIKCKCQSFVLANPISFVESKPRNNISRFISVGRLEDQKDYLFQIDSFVELLKQKPHLSLDIFGSGSLKDVLNKRISELGVENNIKIHEYTDNIAREYLEHDAFIFTTKYEGFPNVLAEAMANCLPSFITYFKTGCDDLISDGETGFVCKERDPKMFADMIFDELNDIEKVKQVAVNGQKHIRDLCSTDSFVNKIDLELQKLLVK